MESEWPMMLNRATIWLVVNAVHEKAQARITDGFGDKIFTRYVEYLDGAPLDGSHGAIARHLRVKFTARRVHR